MAIKPEMLLKVGNEPSESAYSDIHVMLYALGVGMGRDPMNPDELPYVYERGLKTLPTLLTVITRPSFGGNLLGDAGVNLVMLVHGEQRLRLEKPIPPKGELLTLTKPLALLDKGKEKGAVYITESEIRLKGSNELLGTLGSTLMFRGDGGFGGPSSGGPEPHELPGRAPDLTVEMPTRADQALLYRLNGDRNPLHSDPEFAKAAGFPRPILHGLCSYGIAAHAVLKAVCDYDHTRMKSFDVRFSRPVFPGETLLVDLWTESRLVSFRARIKERPETTVLNNGRCELFR
ncbi:MAG: 3-alpha,7-alpha,12-alpha-trihydroxy-5-beta-cholest-24-enoyl-CoA hydratase [Alphaproteobacteria bacterium]|nr:3-alpha,7-alpha,12-alpha-trihydroxy-5-beta-cholest-24-enoyl-CoA hydratase [Alphaproteobacteria bacterium]